MPFSCSIFDMGYDSLVLCHMKGFQLLFFDISLFFCSRVFFIYLSLST